MPRQLVLTQSRLAPTTTLIVPYRVHAPSDDSARRLRRLLAYIPADLPIIVVDDSPSPTIRRQTEALVRERAGAVHLDAHPGDDRPFSVGRSRDVGSEAARTELVLFHDVDFIAPLHVYATLLCPDFHEALFARNQDAFACIPVLFLDKAGTAVFRAVGPIWRSTASYRLRDLLLKGQRGRLVLGSSAMMMRRATLLAAGGHSEVFEGHGAEDFELMHRLSQAYPIGQRPLDYAEDCGSSARPLTGFRGYFARYGEAALARGAFLYHPWHEPRRTDPHYLGSRHENLALLKSIMTSSPN